ncbi:gfo/Idh/MocA family oxidoreductase [Paenibacillus psychroresistens]|uniref:Gfo/Idh/MocA family oxidoreductase n=1 Tax=Paenibacillus psychroresistens TaxID=1778678 RepID=A0A6B8RQT1_9BACL|nr:Gfo/Idh/MocA family oxidoreductase [Paenibacillus psychroresistens]QGQ98072.1 gfo/Idh/MocA family oxidoreductase [Paenibacillus psychroresistens]
MFKIISFGIVGSGWRTEFYMRIAQALPNRFRVSGVVMRDENKGLEFEAQWRVPTFRTIEQLLEKTNFDFIVLSLPWEQLPIYIEKLAGLGVPVLSETPPAPTLDALNTLYKTIGPDAKVQVAEQLALQPLHAARIAIANSGLLGTVSQAQISVAHGYHGISLIRKFLNISFEDARIHGYSFSTPIVEGPGRYGGPAEEKPSQSKQTVATLEFDGKIAIFDFTGDQYFSWIRSPRVLVRGDRGEIMNSQVKYLQDYQTPIELELRRVNAGEGGNLEGYYHKGYLAGERWVYSNPFTPGSLSDDEIAIATCLEKMAAYANGGPSFYSLAEASQDHYLGMMIDRAVETREIIQTNKQAWA